jgi:hypothetical protein
VVRGWRDISREPIEPRFRVYLHDARKSVFNSLASLDGIAMTLIVGGGKGPVNHAARPKAIHLISPVASFSPESCGFIPRRVESAITRHQKLVVSPSDVICQYRFDSSRRPLAVK